MPKADHIYIDPSITNFTNAVSNSGNNLASHGPTPYGIYDADKAFASESIDVSRYVARKLGHPVMQLEFNSASIWACFEEATSDYSTYINNYNARNWLWNYYGNETRLSGSQWGTSGSGDEKMGYGSSEPVKPNMGVAAYLSDTYGEAVGVGGDATLYTGSITLSSTTQVYDLQNDATLEQTGSKLEIQNIFNQGPAAISRFYDPFAGSFDQRSMLDSFGMGNVSPAVSFIMRPIYWDVTRAAAIETNDRIRKSAYSFELINNKLRIFPIPNTKDTGDKVWFQYYVKEDKNKISRNWTDGKVSDPSNIPYKFKTYSEINSSGRQWIRRYTLATAKELLGIIRSKYATMPLPNGEVSMDGDSLKAEGREEKQLLVDELKEFLDSVSLTEKAKSEQEQAESQQQVLNKAPLGIYIG